ncbi:hypothetical protein [uncultured Brevibacillus sp.]|nr:hypothetical protein [uncultured Brevibacillus sp.]
MLVIKVLSSSDMPVSTGLYEEKNGPDGGLNPPPDPWSKRRSAYQVY